MTDNINQSTEKKLILFDVDHTLLVGNNAHWNAYQMAFKQIYDIIIPEDFPPWHGYTDLQIIYSLMDMYNIARDENKAQQIIQVMVNEFKKMNYSGSRLLSGVEPLLKALSIYDNIILGLVTGNIEDIAYAKLKHLRIDEYFILGGFGDISDKRSHLIIDAIKKAEKKFGKIDKKDVIIVGDTPNDIRAAREAGVKVIAVATGENTVQEISKYNPDYLFNDLKDTNKIIEVIKNG